MAAGLQMEQVVVQVQEKTEVNRLGFCAATNAKNWARIAGFEMAAAVETAGSGRTGAVGAAGG